MKGKELKHESNKNCELIVENTSENFATWLSREYISDALRTSLADIDILIIPIENFSDAGHNPFPVSTDVLFQYFKNSLPSEYIIDLCIEDSDYCEIALDSRLRRIGNFVVSSVVLALFLNVLGNYIYDKIIKTNEKSKIQFEITVVEQDKSKTFKYEGDSESYKNISDEILKLWNEEK